MALTREELEEWFERGRNQGFTHMIVVCDTFDHEDYPVYVRRGDEVQTVFTKYNGPNMQRVMEVYALHKDFDKQKMNGRFCMDFEAPPLTKVAEPDKATKALVADIDKVLKKVEKEAKKMAGAGMCPDWTYVVELVREELKKHSEK
jgi:hypothetical protein